MIFQYRIITNNKNVSLLTLFLIYYKCSILENPSIFDIHAIYIYYTIVYSPMFILIEPFQKGGERQIILYRAPKNQNRLCVNRRYTRNQIQIIQALLVEHALNPFVCFRWETAISEILTFSRFSFSHLGYSSLFLD